MKIVGQLKAILGLDKSKFDAGLKSAEKGAGTFGKSLKAIFASAGLALGIKELIRFGLESAKLAAKAEGVKAAFERLNSPTLLQDLRRATKNTVSDVQLMTNAIRANNFRLPLEQLPKYFEFATRRARETGDSVDYLVDSIVLGISRESPKILDNLGLSLSEINEELKKTPNYAEAVGNIIERELRKAGDAADDAGVKFMQFSASWEGLKESAGGVVNKSGLPKLLDRWAVQMRILGDESMTAAQKIAMLMTTRIDKSAYNNYLEHINNLKKATSGYNWGMGQSAKMGFSTGFNMLSGIKPAQVKTLQSLTDEIASLEEMMMGLSITNEEEIRSTVKQIEAKKKQIDAIMGVGEAVKKTKREIQDAAQVWGEMLKPEQMSLGNIAYSKNNIGGFTGTPGGMSKIYADPKKLAKTTENLAGLGGAYDEINSKVLSLSNSISDVFYGALTGDDFFKSIGESLKRLAAQFAATATAAALLALAISMIPGFGQIMGIKEGASFGNVFGQLFKGGMGLGMAEGGTIPSGYPNDSFGPVMLSSGETVLTARQSQWLKDGIKVNVVGTIYNRDISLANRRSNYSN